jgi:hypothetical protein
MGPCARRLTSDRFTTSLDPLLSPKTVEDQRARAFKGEKDREFDFGRGCVHTEREKA